MGPKSEVFELKIIKYQNKINVNVFLIILFIGTIHTVFNQLILTDKEKLYQSWCSFMKSVQNIKLFIIILICRFIKVSDQWKHFFKLMKT